MRRYVKIETLRRPNRSGGRLGRSAGRRARPLLEHLELRLALSVGGGWINSAQSGQSGEGLLGQYFSNSNLTGTPSFTRWDDRADFTWTADNAYPGGSPAPGYGSVGPNGWSAKWNGVLTPNFSQTYTFAINSAGNGVRLWVTPMGGQQGSPLVNDWSYHGQKTDTATMALVAGHDYTVELDYSETSGNFQQAQLEWSSSSTPLEVIEPVNQIGLGVDGGDALFANMVNAAGKNARWFVPNHSSVSVPTDQNNWPEGDAVIYLGLGDNNTRQGGSYLVQFTGMATLTIPAETIDWWANGVDLHTSVLQAGQGYNPTTNTTTATMVVAPIVAHSLETGFYFNFTNTSRTKNSAFGITGISETPNSATVTVTVPSVTGITQNAEVTIAGYTGTAANYNGTYVITSVNALNHTFTYSANKGNLPTNPSGGTALVNPGNGFTNLYVMQPTTLGGGTPSPVGTLFNPAALALFSQYTVVRMSGLSNPTNPLVSNWSDRTLVSDNLWTAQQFNNGTGVLTNVTGGDESAGVPWEVQIALANQLGKDIDICIPLLSSTDYITNLAKLIAFGSNGVTPYSSVQANPIWKPLDPNIKVYIEFSNEIWNSGYLQSESRGDGWANELSQRALYDYLTNNKNDSLYPGGGANAYNDGAVLAAYYNVTGTKVSAFVATYNANPAPATIGDSPLYFSNASAVNGYVIGQGWIGLRDVQISNIFKSIFGETNIAASANNSRIRPEFQWQTGRNWTGALAFINGAYGSQHPVNYYLYGGGGNFYVYNTVGGFSDVGFTNPDFIQGLSGWSSSGPVGVLANGSSLGNPNAPPLFSAIAVSNGATEALNTVTIRTTTPHYFTVGQSVTVAGVTVKGYNGTFTITSVTPTSFTYQDSTAGLTSSGDGFVTGTGYSNRTAYLQPGASLSQNITFSGGYADITLYTAQNVTGDWNNGLTIILTPTNGGPTINNGRTLQESDGDWNFESPNKFTWQRTQAFYTGNKPYTYTVTFKNTLPSGTIFFDGLAIQTVNGMFNETTAAVQSTKLNLSSLMQGDVALTQQYGIHYVSYEGGFSFLQNVPSGAVVNGIVNGYLNMSGVGAGYSSSVPNVGMYANLDPRTEQLALDRLNEYYGVGGNIPIEAGAFDNINSAISAPTTYDWDTPRLQAAIDVEQSTPHKTVGVGSGQFGIAAASLTGAALPTETTKAQSSSRAVRYGTTLDSSGLDAIASLPDADANNIAIGTIPISGFDTSSGISTAGDISDSATPAGTKLINFLKKRLVMLSR